MIGVSHRFIKKILTKPAAIAPRKKKQMKVNSVGSHLNSSLLISHNKI